MRGRPWIEFAAALTLFASGAASFAQKAAPGEIRVSNGPYQPRQALRVESRVVQLEVVVRDAHGVPVPGFTKKDFAVFDSGKAREITSFSQEIAEEAARSPVKSASNAAQPAPSRDAGETKRTAEDGSTGRWIALLFDDVSTGAGDLGHAKIAASRFVKEAVAEGDHFAIVTSSFGRVLDFTADTALVLAKVAGIQSHLRISSRDAPICPRITPYEAYEIVQNDAIVMQAKVQEGCHCTDIPDTCDVSQMLPGTLLNPGLLNMPSSGNTDPELAGPIQTVILNVRSQAQATWNQVRFASQASLEAIASGVDYLANAPGKRVMLFASSGFLSGSLDEQVYTIINKALQAGIVINSIDAKGLYAEAPGPSFDEPLGFSDLRDVNFVVATRSLGEKLESLDAAEAQFAESTGGLLFRDNNDLEAGFRRLGLIPRYAYVLGFLPAEDGKYHKVKVALTNGSHDFVQVRPGYFAPSQISATQVTPEDKLDAAALATDEKSELPITFTEEIAPTNSGLYRVKVEFRVDIRRLPFLERDDRKLEKLKFVAVLFDPRSRFINGEQGEMDLALQPSTFERLSESGVGGSISLVAAPGAYRLRLVVEDASQSKMSAGTKPIQIP